MKKIALILIITFSTFSYAEDEYSKTVFEFLEVTGANETQRVMLNQMFSQFQQMQPDNPYFKDMSALMNKELNNLNKQLVPIYKKHIPLEDLKALIKLYKTPVAKRMVSKQPQIVKESMQVGMAWGQDVAQTILKK